MKVEMLISSCKLNKIKELSLEKKNITNAIIVNQFMPKESVQKEKNYIMYSYNEKGIAKSRNRLLEHMTGDIEIITDDDISFNKNSVEIIEKAYKENDADIIIFNLKKGNEIIGKNKKMIYNSLSIMSICSCQITFRSESIRKNNIKFDEKFGIGSTFISGEENIFLDECLKNNLKIIHIPLVINNHPEEETTGEIWNDKVIKSKGALMYRLHRKTYIIFLMYFAILKHKQYKKNYSFFKFIKIFNKGKKEYKNLNK